MNTCASRKNLLSCPMARKTRGPAQGCESIQAYVKPSGRVVFFAGGAAPDLELLGEGVGPEFVARVAALCRAPRGGARLHLAVPSQEARALLARKREAPPGSFEDLIRRSGLPVASIARLYQAERATLYQTKYGNIKKAPPDLCAKLEAMAAAVGGVFGCGPGPSGALILHAQDLYSAALHAADMLRGYALGGEADEDALNAYEDLVAVLDAIGAALHPVERPQKN